MTILVLALFLKQNVFAKLMCNFTSKAVQEGSKMSDWLWGKPSQLKFKKN